MVSSASQLLTQLDSLTAFHHVLQQTPPPVQPAGVQPPVKPDPNTKVVSMTQFQHSQPFPARHEASSSGQTLWQNVLTLLQQDLSPATVEAWIAPMALISVQDTDTSLDPQTLPQNTSALSPCKTVTLSVASSFKRNWVLKHYRLALQQAFAQGLGVLHVRLNLDVADTPTEPAFPPSPASPAVKKPPVYQYESLASVQASKTSLDAPNLAPVAAKTTLTLNPRYRFETYVCDGQNRLAFGAARAVAESPGLMYTPFVLFGEAGCGKTHLMQAIGHFTQQYHPDLSIRCMSAEQFTLEMVQAIQKKTMPAFRDRLRRLDVLMVEDIQFLAGKTRTQEEFLNTLAVLVEAGKQVVLTMNEDPASCQGLDATLVNRLMGGLSVPVFAPQRMSRVQLLQQKIAADTALNRLEWSESLLQQIAAAAPASPRGLDGLFNRVAAQVRLTGEALTEAQVHQLLFPTAFPISEQGITQGLPAEGTVGRVSPYAPIKIIETVAGYFYLSAQDVVGASRTKDVAYARQLAVYVLREKTGLSYQRIGALLGGRKHHSILYACQKVEKALQENLFLRRQLTEILEKLG